MEPCPSILDPSVAPQEIPQTRWQRRTANWTPAQHEEYRQNDRERKLRIRLARTPAQQENIRAQDRESYRLRMEALTPDQLAAEKLKVAAENHRYLESIGPEGRQALKDKDQERHRQNRASMTPAQMAEFLERHREINARYKENFSPEELAAFRERDRLRQSATRAAMSPEEKARYRLHCNEVLRAYRAKHPDLFRTGGKYNCYPRKRSTGHNDPKQSSSAVEMVDLQPLTLAATSA